MSRSHADYIPVNHLPQADLILVLGDNGQVVKQGSYAQLRDNAEGFIQIHDDIQLTQTEGSDENGNGLAEPPNPIANSFSAPCSTDSNRKTTDLAVYKYYFSALGWLRVSALLLFLAADAGLSGSRCKLD